MKGHLPFKGNTMFKLFKCLLCLKCKYTITCKNILFFLFSGFHKQNGLARRSQSLRLEKVRKKKCKFSSRLVINGWYDNGLPDWIFLGGMGAEMKFVVT